MSRCRLCTTNDREALIDQLADEMWRNEADGRPLVEAGVQWRLIYRQFAERTIALLEREHG